MAALAEALALACSQGYVRVFADEGPPVATLLAPADRSPAVQRGGRGDPARLPGPAAAPLGTQNTAPNAGRGSVTAAPRLVEQLTNRELGMLAAGRSNPAIASQLVVTLDTVKKHVSHVLGQARRGQPHRGRQPRTRASLSFRASSILMA